MLPPVARIRIAVDPSAAWGWSEHLLADISYSLRWLVWSKTKDGSKNRNRPKRILPPGSKETEEAGTTRNTKKNMSEVILVKGEYLARLEKRRKEE